MAQQVGEIKFWGTPTLSPLPQGGFVQVETGWTHAIGLRPDGTVECWSVNEPFGCANAPGLHEKFVYIVAGYYHNFGIRADGTLRAWGTSITGDEATVPADLEGVQVLSVAAAEKLSAAVLIDGTLRAWGENPILNCGDDTSCNACTPSNPPPWNLQPPPAGNT